MKIYEPFLRILGVISCFFLINYFYLVLLPNPENRCVDAVVGVISFYIAICIGIAVDYIWGIFKKGE